jgi:hypothetical protein
LIALGPIGAGPAIVFKYWLPVGVCAVSIMILIFYRHGEQDKQT